MESRRLRDRSFGRVLILCVSIAAVAVVLRPAASAYAEPTLSVRPEDDTLKGRSGKLRAVLVPRSGRRIGVLEPLFGDSLPGLPAFMPFGTAAARWTSP